MHHLLPVCICSQLVLAVDHDHTPASPAVPDRHNARHLLRYLCGEGRLAEVEVDAAGPAGGALVRDGDSEGGVLQAVLAVHALQLTRNERRGRR